MKKYHVYGIGNAIVDVEATVEDSFLEKGKIEKGVMTLVDKQRHSELDSLLNGTKHDRSCGGSAANTMIGISQFGGKSFYSCKVASDEWGTFYYNDLLKEGVKTNLTDDRQEGVTGRCMVFVTPDAERTMNTFLGITETFSENELIESELSDSEYLYIEGYLVTSETGRAAAIKAKAMAEKNNVKVAMTFSDPAMAEYFGEGLTQMIGTGVDLLFCNEQEAMTYSKTNTIEDAVKELRKVAKKLVITLGAKGALLFDGEKTITVPSHEVKAVDSNGAGDLFAGAFMYAITNGHSFEEAGKLSTKSASVLVTQFGARLRSEQATKIKSEVLNA